MQREPPHISKIKFPPPQEVSKPPFYHDNKITPPL